MCIRDRQYDLSESYAYSDSITDAPMLGAVGHGYAVNPDRSLRRLAAQEGWGILMFRRPISLRNQLAPAAPAALTVGGAALAIGGAALVWRAVRKRRLQA